MLVVILSPTLPKLDASQAVRRAGRDKTPAQIRGNRPDRLFFSVNPLVCQCAGRGKSCQIVSLLLCSAGAWACLEAPWAQLSRNKPDRLFFWANPLVCACAGRGV